MIGVYTARAMAPEKKSVAPSALITTSVYYDYNHIVYNNEECWLYYRYPGSCAITFSFPKGHVSLIISPLKYTE